MSRDVIFDESSTVDLSPLEINEVEIPLVNDEGHLKGSLVRPQMHFLLEQLFEEKMHLRAIRVAFLLKFPAEMLSASLLKTGSKSHYNPIQTLIQ